MKEVTQMNMMAILSIVLALDLLIPFLIAPTYKGYCHLTQVMSVLGNVKAPLHVVYNVWLVVYGIILVISNFRIYDIISRASNTIAILLFIIILLYAIGGCILSGLFSVGETKSLNTISEKIHGFGSVIGFTALVFAPLLIGIYAYQSARMGFGMAAISCFVLALVAFLLFVMADKSRHKNTILCFEGLWQRLSLLLMYLPIGCLVFFQD